MSQSGRSPFTRREFLEISAVAGFAMTLANGCASRQFEGTESSPDLFGSDKRGEDSQYDLVTKRPTYPQDPETLPPGKERKILVIGGGVAGLCAGIELAERGYKVTVRESESYLGGRLHTQKLSLPVGEFQVEHGLHMWFHQYYNFMDLLGKDRLNVVDKYFVDFNEVKFLFENYKPELIESKGFYPLNLVGIVVRSPNLNFLSAIGVVGALPEIVGFDYSRVMRDFDNMTLEEYATRRKVNKDFYNIVLKPAASVTLNDPKKVSAAEMLKFTNLYFLGHPKAFHRKVTKVDHGTAVINPMAARIREKGGQVLTSKPVKGLVIENGNVVGCVGESETYDGVILATCIPGAKTILGASIAKDPLSQKSLSELREGVAQMKVAPPYHMLRTWFDKPTNSDRPPYEACIETPDFSPIHLVGLFHMLEEECKTWAQKNNGSIIEYHLYNTPEFVGKTAEEIWESIKELAWKVTPELKDQGAVPLAHALGSYHNFTSYEVGQATLRLDVLSAREVNIKNLALCGDWINPALYQSALMECAASTGREAANMFLLDDRVREAIIRHPKTSGPGLLPKF